MTAEQDDPQHGVAVDDDVPVCASCFTPFEPGTNFCQSCGTTVGQHTEYVPFVNIRWQADGIDRLRLGSWTPQSSVLGRIIQMVVTVALAPVLLLGHAVQWIVRWREAGEP